MSHSTFDYGPVNKTREVVKRREKLPLISWWGAFYGTSPFAKVALTILNVVPTSTGVKQITSIQSSKHTKTRNRLAQSKVKKIMNLVVNGRLSSGRRLKFVNSPEHLPLPNDFDDIPHQDDLSDDLED